jgi:hypothetical protein
LPFKALPPMSTGAFDGSTGHVKSPSAGETCCISEDPTHRSCRRPSRRQRSYILDYTEFIQLYEKAADDRRDDRRGTPMTSVTIDMSGKVALVTGGYGMGRACARRLLRVLVGHRLEQPDGRGPRPGATRRAPRRPADRPAQDAEGGCPIRTMHCAAEAVHLHRLRGSVSHAVRSDRLHEA